MTTTTATAPPAAGTTPRRRWRNPVPGPVWAMAVFAAGLAVALALTTFRHGSVDNDDAVYLLQARLLAHGHLTGALPAYPNSQQPWFFAITSHGYVPKYLPVVALLYAVGLVLFGTVVPVLAVLAFVLPLCVHALARTAGLERRRAIVATGVVALSPAVLIQGGLVLSYLPFLVLLVLGWTLLLVVWRSGNPYAAAGFGLIAATAACFRPFDPVVLLGPAALFVAWRLGRRAVRPVAAAVVGALPIGVLVLLYDRHATGSATHLPFNLLSPSDSFGYGTHRLVPEDPPLHFGPVQGLHGFWLHFLAEPAGWMVAFVLVLPLAAWNLRRGGAASAQTRLVAASGAVFAISYLAFWGPWNTSVLWGGPNTVGPFYAIPTLVPIALAAASWWPTRVPAPSGRWAFRVAVVVGIGALVGNVVTVRYAVEHNWSAAQRTTTVVHAVDDAPGTVLLDVDPPYLAHPVGAIGDEPLGDERTILLASQLSAAQVQTVPDPTLVQIPGGVYGTGGLNLRVVHEVRTTGTSLQLHVVDLGLLDTRAVLVVSHDGVQQACEFGGEADLTVTATTVAGCTDYPITTKLAKLLAEKPYRLCPTADCVSYDLFRLAGKTGVGEYTWRMTPIATTGGELTALTDGATIAERGGSWISVSAGS